MMNPQELYQTLGNLVATFPDFRAHPLSQETQMWLGRVGASVQEVGNLNDPVHVISMTGSLNSNNALRRLNASDALKPILYRNLAIAELKAPAPVRGAFIPAGNEFDAFAAVGRVLATADTDVLIVDPYMDECTLTDFAVLATEQVSIRLLADSQHVKASLSPAVGRWHAQYVNVRSLVARLAPARSLHDRLIIVDSRTAWILTQSLNAFARRAPATIVRSDEETSRLKVDAYQQIWEIAAAVE